MSQVAADWHELMILQCIMLLSGVVRASEQLDLQCSMQTHHCFRQAH